VATASALFASDDGGTTWRDLAAVPEAEGHRGTGLSALSATAAAFADDGSLAVQGRDGAALLVRRPDGSWHAPLQDWDPGGGGYDVSIEGEAWWALLGQHGTFNGVARSVDGGLTWDVLAGGDLPERGTAVAPAPRSVLALSDRAALVTLGGRLLRTDDGGRSWREVTSDVDAALVRSADDPEVVVGSGAAGVRRSDDGGRTFRPVVGGPGGAADVALGPGGRVYATVPAGDQAGVWRFEGSWRHVLAVVGAGAVAVPSDGADQVLVAVDGGPPPAGGGGVLASVDGGRTWDAVGAPGAGGSGLGPTTLVAAEGGDVVAGTDGGGFHRLAPG
jgi:photosystem II stability/assembly factor-like uncharacterized protein